MKILKEKNIQMHTLHRFIKFKREIVDYNLKLKSTIPKISKDVQNVFV